MKSPVGTKIKCVFGLVMAVLVTSASMANEQPTVSAQREPAPITTEQFVKLHPLIKPRLGELRFHEIPWLIDVWEARKKAAAEGKPILVWSGAGGSPVGVC